MSFRVRPPDAQQLQKFLCAARTERLTYEEVGATGTTPPNGYHLDHTRVPLGNATAFGRARAALESWHHMRLDWVRVPDPAPPIAPGETVAILAHAYGLWSLNACRIVYVIDEKRGEDGSPFRFGFAYGTLPSHVEEGEERFLVEQLDDGSVWYDILAFSRPRHPLVRLASPLGRRLQRRFARESAAKMLSACRLAESTP